MLNCEARLLVFISVMVFTAAVKNVEIAGGIKAEAGRIRWCCQRWCSWSRIGNRSTLAVPAGVICTIWPSLEPSPPSPINKSPLVLLIASASGNTIETPLRASLKAEAL